MAGQEGVSRPEGGRAGQKHAASKDYGVFQNGFPESGREARLDGAWRTKRPTARRAHACPAQVGLAVLSQPPSKPKIFEEKTAC
ncbi:MAG: hypothetical protein B7Z21_01130 [Verrucomicrobiales bacterium 32-60-5]|nr:MAG: hypothetical protein B7Z21_01130 [Verrucomicrobiales bacterium 32-60-5]